MRPPLFPKRPDPQPLFAALRLPHFSAQALSVRETSLRNRPFAVVEQSAQSHKTPIVALSRAALAWGLHAGMPAFMALRGRSELPMRMRNLSAEAALRESLSVVLVSYSPVYTIRNNGQALLDMTGTPLARNAEAEQWGTGLRVRLLELGMEMVAVGIGTSRIVAQVSARLAGPGGVGVCRSGMERALLDPLSPGILPGLSAHAREQLRKYGLVSVQQVRGLGREELALRFGPEAEKIYCLAQGIDMESAVLIKAPISAETVLSSDWNDEAALRGQLRLTADKLGHALRDQGRLAGRMALALRYSDGQGLRKTIRLHPATSAFTAIAAAAEKLFEDLHQRRVALRRIRLEAPHPATETGQTDIFDRISVQKQEALAEAIHQIRRKRGFRDLVPGSSLQTGNVGDSGS